jgi:biopolymer transport protein ExbB
MEAFFDFFLHHWYFAIPMLLMSMAGVALVVWRLMLNVNGSTKMDAFLPAFQDKLDKEGVPGALRFCRSRTDVIPRRLYVAGLEASKQGLAGVRRAMANAIELEIAPDLNFLLPTILAIAKIATMVGLLGTVLSMIGVFNSIQTQAQGVSNEQVRQLGLALFATALGLVTAIPLVFAHVLFRGWVARFELRMKSAAQRLLFLLANVKSDGKAAGTAAAVAAPIKPGIDPSSVARR